MKVILKHEVGRIKNGFSARSTSLRLTAHGYSPETARLNLERLVLLFFRPFQRDGTLQQELLASRLDAEEYDLEDEEAFTVALAP